MRGALQIARRVPDQTCGGECSVPCSEGVYHRLEAGRIKLEYRSAAIWGVASEIAPVDRSAVEVARPGSKLRRDFSLPPRR